MQSCGMKPNRMKAYFEGEKGTFVFRPIGKRFGKEAKQKMLVFSERRRLAKMFDEWADANNAAKKAENVIAFLQTLGVIDAEKAREAMASEET